jgi:hypothetical protein
VHGPQQIKSRLTESDVGLPEADVDYAETSRTLQGNSPVTHARLTPAEWTTFERYLANLTELLGGLE